MTDHPTPPLDAPLTDPEAICVQCFVRFPISREEWAWIGEEGVRVLCPECWHAATGVDEFNDKEG